MAFKKPDLAKLYALAEYLEKRYSGTNELRYSVIYLLKQATEDAKKQPHPRESHDLMMATVTAILENIRCHEYASCWWSARGSNVYSDIEDFLDINEKNPYSSYERLPYLYKAQSYYQNVYSEEKLTRLREIMEAAKKAKNNSHINCIWASKQDVQKFTDTSVNAHLYYFRKNVEAQLASTKELAALRKDTQEIPGEYEALVPPAARRPHLTEMIRTLYRACLRLYLPNYENESDDSNDKEEFAHMGLHYFLMNSIEDSSWLSPERGLLGWRTGSRMYQIVKKHFGKDFHKFDTQDKLKLLNGLIELLNRIRNAPKFFKEQKAIWDKGDKGVPFGDFETAFQKFSNDVHNYKLKIEKSENQASVSGLVVSASAGYAAQTVAKQAAENGFKYLASTAILAGFGVSATNPISLAVSATATILFLSVSYVARKTVAGRVVVGLMQSGIDVATGVAGDKIADLANSLFATREKLQSLRKSFKPEEDQIYCDWVNTLLKFNHKFVSEQRKEVLRHGLGLNPGEELKPKQYNLGAGMTTFELQIKEEEYDPSKAKQAELDAKYEKEEVIFKAIKEEKHDLFLRPQSP